MFLCLVNCLKEIVHLKITILLLMNHPHVVLNPLDLIFATQIKIFVMKSESYPTPHIDRNATDKFKAQKGSKDIIKIDRTKSILVAS